MWGLTKVGLTLTIQGIQSVPFDRPPWPGGVGGREKQTVVTSVSLVRSIPHYMEIGRTMSEETFAVSRAMRGRRAGTRGGGQFRGGLFRASISRGIWGVCTKPGTNI